MLHPILLAGRPETQYQNEEDLCPLHFEQDAGVPSRFVKLLHTMNGDVFATPKVVTTQDCGELAADQARNIQDIDLILEPGCHKPAAALLAALLAMRQTPDALVVVAHASVDFDDPAQLDTALCHAIPAAQRGEIVMLGQRASRQYGGHGTLEIGAIPRDTTPISVHRVVPSGRSNTLASLYQTLHQIQGLGVYVARVDTLLAAFNRYASRMVQHTKAALVQAVTSREGSLLDAAEYDRVKPLSFERAVACKSKNIVAIQTDCEWSSLREWDQDSRADVAMADSFGAWDADLAAESAMAGRLDSAASPNRASEMLSLLESLTHSGHLSAPEGAEFTKSEHAWGSYETLAVGPGFALQRLILGAGQSVELIASQGEAEHWIIVKGSALLMVSDQMKLLWQHQSARIPAGRARRIENPGHEPLQMVQLKVSAQPETASSPSAVAHASPVGVA